MNPELMLFDEVTAALDPEIVREVFRGNFKLAKRWNDYAYSHSRDGICKSGSR